MARETVSLRFTLFFPLLLVINQSSAGELSTHQFESSVLGRSWSYNIYLPAGYTATSAAYPTLYLLHGSGRDLHAWVELGNIVEITDDLVARHEIPPLVIVLPDAGSSWYVDSTEAMETAIISELIPRIEDGYRVGAERESRMVAGAAMGGYGAMRFAFKYPELFGAAALLSPGIFEPEPPEGSTARRGTIFGESGYDPEVWKRLNYPSLWESYLAKKLPVPMYINSGDDDRLRIEVEVMKLYSLLRDNEQPAELRIVDGDHSWDVWRSTIGDAMEYMLSAIASMKSTN